MSSILGPLDEGPKWNVMSDTDVLERARDLPVGLGEMLVETLKESFITSSGLGTAVRDAAIPESVPSRDVTVPDELTPRDPMAVPRLGEDGPVRFQPPAGVFLEGEQEYQQRRKDAGALSKEEWQASPSFREKIPYDPGMTADRAAALAAWHDASQARQAVIAKGPGGVIGNTVWIGGMLAGSALDPVNYIPIFGPEVRAAQIAKFGRVGGSALTSAGDAALNTAIMSGLTAGTRQSFGDDVTWQTFVTDVAIGAAIGGAFGAATSRWEGWKQSRAANEINAVVEARAAINDAIDDVVHGRPVEITPTVADAVEKAAARVNPAKEMPSFTVFHGSPHDFDRFSIDKIGTGEGAQAYGHGLYFAEGENVAKSYRDKLSQDTQLIGGKPVDVGNPEHIAASYTAQHGSRQAAIAKITEDMRDLVDDPATGAAAREAINILSSGRDLPPVSGAKGRIYEVRINADPDTFIDWDKPLSEQSEAVQRGVKELQDIYGSMGTNAIAGDMRGGQFVQLLGAEGISGNKARASQDLAAAGIKGIKYLDAGSRDGGGGTRNYVLFDDSLAEIVAKDGKMVVGQPRIDPPDPSVTAAAASVGKRPASAAAEFGMDKVSAPVTKPVEAPKPATPEKQTVTVTRGDDGRINGAEISKPAQELADQFGIDTKSGDFPEMAEFDQLVALGRVTPAELDALRRATEIQAQTDDFARALEAAAICRVGV